MSFTWISGFKRERKVRANDGRVNNGSDGLLMKSEISDQVKVLLQRADQKLILMVRG